GRTNSSPAPEVTVAQPPPAKTAVECLLRTTRANREWVERHHSPCRSHHRATVADSVTMTVRPSPDPPLRLHLRDLHAKMADAWRREFAGAEGVDISFGD